MTQQLILDLLSTPTPTLENFVVGKNQAVLDALNSCEPGRALYLWGAQGAGRTHLLRALGTMPRALYFGVADRADTLKDIATGDSVALDLIAIDDVGQLNEHAQSAVFALYNRWREVSSTRRAFVLLLAGDQAPLAMPLREDLRTRLGWDLVFRLEPLSDGDLAVAFETRANEKGLKLTPEITNWVLTHYARDMGRLGALLDALDRYSLEKHRAITLPLLKDLLSMTPMPAAPLHS
ncbi:MAG TPA: DnaA regulatory inactivator Hda [Paralcaligenes sp.]|jgi:DnaA regulatory inactivator Hda